MKRKLDEIEAREIADAALAFAPAEAGRAKPVDGGWIGKVANAAGREVHVFVPAKESIIPPLRVKPRKGSGSAMTLAHLKRETFEKLKGSKR